MDDVRCAEQALVGSLVLAPNQLREVDGWLNRSDFGEPACGLLYERVRELSARGAEPAGRRLLEELRRRGELRPDGYPISELTRWFDAVPTRSHAGAYGALVVEGALGRQLQATGTRMVQVAERPEPARALIVSVTARATIAAAHRRWCALPAAVRTAADTQPPAVRLDRDGSRRVARHGDRGEQAELMTVGSLLAAPQLASRAPWLQSRDFASRDLAQAFAAVTSMTAAGLAVDRVTVAAELHRRGVVGAGGGWDRVLARAEAAVPMAISVGLYARQVLDDSVVHQVGLAGGRLVELGRTRAGGAAAMLGAALAELDGLDDVHRRLRHSRVVRAVRPPVAERAAVRVAVRHVAGPTSR